LVGELIEKKRKKNFHQVDKREMDGVDGFGGETLVVILSKRKGKENPTN